MTFSSSITGAGLKGPYTVIQPQEFGEGYEHVNCHLEEDCVGELFLSPDANGQLERSGFTSLPQVPDGWPALHETEEEYYQWVANFRGEHNPQPVPIPMYITNLLSDVKLNIRYGVPYEFNGNRFSVSDQLLLDIRRRHLFIINGQILHSAIERKKTTYGSNAESGLELLDRCVRALNGNVNLTLNSLKLATQATVAHLTIIIWTRMMSLCLGYEPSCIKQTIEIDSRTPNITEIRYKNIWRINNSIESIPVPPHRFQTETRIQVPTDDLEKNIGRDAIVSEVISPFFNSEKEASDFDTRFFQYPSGARTKEDYFIALENAFNKEFEIPSLYARSIFHCLKEIEESSNLLPKSSQELNKLFGNTLPYMWHFIANNQPVIKEGKLQVLIEGEEPAKQLYDAFLQKMENNVTLTNQILTLAFEGVYEYLTLICHEQINAIALEIIAQAKLFKVIVKSGSDNNICLDIQMIFGLFNITGLSTDHYFIIGVRVEIPRSDLQRNDLANLIIREHRSPLLTSLEKAKKYDWLVKNDGWTKI